MSELITRRTFLKATGAAALVAAAGSMLVGCGEGYGATPGNPTLPTLDTSHYKGLLSYSVGMGAFSGTFESNSVYERDGCRHYYLYTALGFQSVDTSFLSAKTRSLLHLRKAISPKTPAALTTSLLTVPHRNINTLKLYRSKPVTLLFLSMLILALSTMWTSLMSAPLMSPTRMAPIRSPSLTVRPLTLPRSNNLQFKIPADLHVCRDFSFTARGTLPQTR